MAPGGAERARDREEGRCRGREGGRGRGSIITVQHMIIVMIIVSSDASLIAESTIDTATAATAAAMSTGDV